MFEYGSDRDRTLEFFIELINKNTENNEYQNKLFFDVMGAFN